MVVAVSPPVANRHERTVRVVYPASRGEIELRTDLDWDRAVTAARRPDADTWEFDLAADRSWVYFKPTLIDDQGLHWTPGMNDVVTLARSVPYVVYPHFFSRDQGHLTELLDVPSPRLGRDVHVRAYLPAGYHENTAKRSPVLYMQDGANAFLQGEAFGRPWDVHETLETLDWMSLIHQTIVVAVHTDDRNTDYTAPGYEAYVDALADDVKPAIDARLRTLTGPSDTSVMGSSLGGVASFAAAWLRPDAFGHAACLSSTFGYRDDLMARVQHDDLASREHLRIYLDSGWPRDNYEGTLSMAAALLERGFELGRNLYHVAIPGAQHSEVSWSARAHLPLQMFAGRLRRHFPPSA